MSTTTTPMPVLLGTVGTDLTREQWLERRKAGIGGSEAAAIAGASDWASPLSVYLDKVGAVPPQEQNEAMEWGSRLEAAVILKFEDATGYAVGGRQDFYQSAEHPFMLATIDGRFVGHDLEDWLYEGKTTNAWKAQEWRDGVPLHVWVQVQHDLAVTGLRHACVATLVGGNHYEQHEVAREDEYIAVLIEMERIFYERHMLPQVPPPVEGHKADTDALALLYPESNDAEVLTLGPGAEEALSDYLAYALAEREAGDEKTAAQNRLKQMLGEAEAGVVGEWRVSWKSQTRTSIDAKRLRAEQPDLAEQYSKESSSRVFRVTDITPTEADDE